MATSDGSDRWARGLAVLALVVASIAVIWQIKAISIQKAQFEAGLEPEVTIWAGRSPNPDFVHQIGIRNTGAADLCAVRVLHILYAVCVDTTIWVIYTLEAPTSHLISELKAGAAVGWTDQSLEPDRFAEFLRNTDGVFERLVGVLAVRVECRRVADLERFEFANYYHVNDSGEIDYLLEAMPYVFKEYVSVIETYRDDHTLERDGGLYRDLGRD